MTEAHPQERPRAPKKVQKTPRSTQGYNAERRLSRRMPGRDHFSSLALEIFLPIVQFSADVSSPRPNAPLKSLSLVNRIIRSKCITAGLFRSLLVTLQHGAKSIVNICCVLRMKEIPSYYIYTLTITEYILGECPSEISSSPPTSSQTQKSKNQGQSANGFRFQLGISATTQLRATSLLQRSAS